MPVSWSYPRPYVNFCEKSFTSFFVFVSFEFIFEFDFEFEFNFEFNFGFELDFKIEFDLEFDFEFEILNVVKNPKCCYKS